VVSTDAGREIWTVSPPSCEPTSIKIHQKGVPEAVKNLINFCIDFLTALARFWGEFGVKLGAMLAKISIM